MLVLIVPLKYLQLSEMWRLLFCVVIIFPMQYVSGVNGGKGLCDSTPEDSRKTLSCSKQILGRDIQPVENDICKIEVYPANSKACTTMSFGPLVPNTSKVGGVTLKPYVILLEHNNTVTPYKINHTVLNITFSNIKWKSLRFRFQDKNRGDNVSKINLRNHCRHINISNDAPIDDRSVLYYDCYWPKTDVKEGQSHILDFEAYGDDDVVNRGQYYFNIPTAGMLSTEAKEEEWKPFIYIEIFPSTMRLHILPPPGPLKINSYKIKVMKECEKGRCEVKSQIMDLKNRTDDVLYDYNFVGEDGLYYFTVTPMHDKCSKNNEQQCNVVESPRIMISSVSQTMNICIASVTALIVAMLFAYYITLRLIRRYWCKDYKRAANEIPQPTKVLVIYSPANRLHAECVISFVTYLRAEYGFDILYDGDISNTSHNDPYIWAEEAFRICSHVMYIVGPAEENNQYSIYDKPIITAHKDVDLLLLSFIKASRVSRNPKEILNVFFEHSNGQIPIETRHDKVFFLLKDWQKLISYLSKNLLPKRQIMRTEKGTCFLDDLTRAKKMLSVKQDDVIVKCDKLNSDKKILL